MRERERYDEKRGTEIVSEYVMQRTENVRRKCGMIREGKESKKGK